MFALWIYQQCVPSSYGWCIGSYQALLKVEIASSITSYDTPIQDQLHDKRVRTVSTHCLTQIVCAMGFFNILGAQWA